MQSIERFVQEQCGGNTIAAAYWLRISENKLIELLGIGVRIAICLKSS